MKVCVVGTGYVGLTTGVSLAFLGHDVTCVDLDEAKVAMLAAGVRRSMSRTSRGLLGEAAERLRFTTEYAVGVPDADVVFIAVQTPFAAGRQPDLRYLRAAADSVGRHVGAGFTVVVNKSTVPIGSGNWVDATAARPSRNATGAARTASSRWRPIPSSSARAWRSSTRCTRTGS